MVGEHPDEAKASDVTGACGVDAMPGRSFLAGEWTGDAARVAC